MSNPSPHERRVDQRTQAALEFIRRHDMYLDVMGIISQVVAASEKLDKHESTELNLQQEIDADILRSLVTALFGEIKSSVWITTGKTDDGNSKIIVTKL